MKMGKVKSVVKRSVAAMLCMAMLVTGVDVSTLSVYAETLKDEVELYEDNLDSDFSELSNDLSDGIQPQNEENVLEQAEYSEENFEEECYQHMYDECDCEDCAETEELTQGDEDEYVLSFDESESESDEIELSTLDEELIEEELLDEKFDNDNCVKNEEKDKETVTFIASNDNYLNGSSALEQSLFIEYYGNAEDVSNVPEGVKGKFADTFFISTQCPERDGYIFLGWCDDCDGYGDFYSEGQEVQLTESVKLYAQWKKNSIEEVFLDFEAKEGEDSSLEFDDDVNLHDEEDELELMNNPSFATSPEYVANDNFNEDWEKWSQKSWSNSNLNANGCRVVAYAKCIREVAEINNDSAIKNEIKSPQSFWEWGINNGAFIKSTVEEVGEIDAIITYLTAKGYTVTKSAAIKYTKNDHATLLNHLNQANTYIIGKIPGHYFYIAKEYRNEKGEPIILDFENGYTKQWSPEQVQDRSTMTLYWVLNIKRNCTNDHFKAVGEENKKDAVGNIKDKTWDGGTGRCNNCSEIAPIFTVDNNRAVYETQDKCAAREFPYNKADFVEIPKGTRVTVTGRVKNLWQKKSEYWPNDYKGNVGHVWYKVEYLNNEYYVYDSHLKYVGTASSPSVPEGNIFVEETLFCTPDSITQGDPTDLTGKITATNCNIEKVQVWFYKVDTKNVLTDNGHYYELLNPDAHCVKMRGAINRSMIANTLAPGNYKFKVCVTARDLKGQKKTAEFYSKSFNVNPKKNVEIKVTAPSYKEDKYIGGKRITVYANNSGGTLYYTDNNGATWGSSNASSVGIEVKNDGTIIRAYYEKSGKRAESAYCVSVPMTQTPTVFFNQKAESCLVCISSESGSSTYYKIDNGSYVPYYGAFSVDYACKISAYSEKGGCRRSNEGFANITPVAPSVPKLICDTKTDIAVGRQISMHWNKDDKAESYTVVIRKNGNEWRSETVNSAQYTFVATEDGEYTANVYASNFVGNSGQSNEIKTVAHPPVKVRFVDYNDELIIERTIDYGESAERPAAPHRRGYTFTGWDGVYTNVIADSVVRAEYEINIYSIRFYDIDGETLLGTQSIQYDEPIDYDEFVDKVTLTNGGRSFTQWAIFYTKENDSYLDLSHIDSDMYLKAVTAWTNEDLPVYIDDLEVSVAYGETSGVFAGYKVTANVSTSDYQDIRAKVIVTLLNNVDHKEGEVICPDGSIGRIISIERPLLGNYDQTEERTYKMVNAKIVTMHFTADTCNLPLEAYIACDGSYKADRVEVSVVSIEGGDRTGGLIAETKGLNISNSASKFWSQWLTEEELAQKGHSIDENGIESKRQYRSRSNTKSTKQTSSATPDPGYTLLSDNSYYAEDWSGWGDNVIYASSTRQVQTQTVTVPGGYTEYRYGCMTDGNAYHDHFCKQCGATVNGISASKYSYRYTDWSTTTYSKYSNSAQVCNYTNHEKGAGGPKYYNYKIGGKNYWWIESRWHDTSYNKTQYRYRDKHLLYTHYKWIDGNWSEWSDYVLVDSNLNDRAYEVEERMVYRYVVYDASELSRDTKGECYKIEGSLDNPELNGKNATILVYKSMNTDPTESQLEFVSQTTLRENGDYSFSFVTKEKPSFSTFDFIVALAVEGSDSLINIDKIRYERKQYKVVFEDETVISEQDVYEGESAELPDDPYKEGYEFIGWSRSTTNITRDMTVYAKYRPKSCDLAFVDYLNQTCTIRKADYGTVIICPNSPEHEGYTFDGWDIDENQTVSDNSIIVAKWTPVKCTVSFVDADGNCIDEQEVEYGSSALPLDYVNSKNGYRFVGWSKDNCWWCVKENMVVAPEFVSEKQLGTPYTNINLVNNGIEDEIVITAEEGAQIFYTKDGSDPLTLEFEYNSADGEELLGEVFEYSEPLVFEDSTDLKIAVRKDGYEDSDVISISYLAPEDRDYQRDNYSEVISLTSRSAEVVDGDQFVVTFGLNEDIALKSMELRIDLDPGVFVPASVEGKALVFYGDLCRDTDELYVRPYEEGTGISIYWRGEQATSGVGELFGIYLDAFTEGMVGEYPIEVGYVSTETFDEEGHYASLDNALNITLSKNDEEFTGESGLVVSGIARQTYTGSAITPKVSVKDNEVLLKEGVDYKLSYVNNVNVGSALDDDAPTVIIKGKGNYEDEIPVSFDIIEADLASLDIVDNGPFIFKYSGKTPKIAIKLKHNKKTLKENRDFKCVYLDENNREVLRDSIYNVGRYYAKLSGLGNYSGERYIDIIISSNDSISKASVAKIPSQVYTGKPIKPSVKVTMKKVTLEEGIDYDVEYYDNIEIGTAKARIIGKNAYAGVKEISFKIDGKSIKKMKVAAIPNKTFNGQYFRPQVVIPGLVENIDYEVSYSNNRNVGTAKVEIVGIGSYSGKLTKTFKILPKRIVSAYDFDIAIFDRGTETYDNTVKYIKGGACPTVSIKEHDNPNNLLPLRQNVDYTLKYKNNNQTKKTASLIIKGKGNYTGSITVKYSVEPQDISKMAITAQDVVYSNRPNKYKTKISIWDLNGKKLSAGKDYDKNFAYRYADRTILQNGLIREAGSAVETSDIIPAGTTIKVKINGIKDYCSFAETEYNVVASSISKARIICADKEYTGKDIKLDPEKEEVRVVLNGKRLVYGVDYEISGYYENVSKGKATVTIKGIGNYGGSAEGKFSIKSRNMLWWIK